MKSRPPLHIVSLVSMLIFLLTGQAGVQGYVWCLGDDGHAALEFVASDSCAPMGPEREQTCLGEESSDRPSGDEHCGPCSDLPASFEAAPRRHHDQKDLSVETGFSAPAQPAVLPPFTQLLTTSLHPNPPPRISQAILAHRTIVLLN